MRRCSKIKRLGSAACACLLALSMASPLEVLAQPEAGSTQIYVAPNGDDSASGTLEAPLKTLEKAQEKVREINGSMSGDIEVILREGTYHLENTLELDSRDSGTNGFHVIYRAYEGEHPIMSGGVPVTGWKQYDADKNIYEADVSGLGETFDTRQLYVDGKRAVRAKGTATGWDFSKGNGFYNISATGVYKDMASWKNQSDIELQSTHAWKNHRLPVTNISDGKINIEPVFWTSAHTQYVAEPGAINMVENAYELLDEENEWYFDKSTKKMYYKPADEANVNDLDIITGNLEYIVRAEGTADAPVQNVEFDGIQFSYNTWLFPNSEFGYPDFQAGNIYKNTTGSTEWVEVNYQTEAGVEFNYTKNSRIQNCIFTSMGNAALSFLDGAENNVVTRNQVYDVSGNGIMLGSIYKEAHQNEPAERLVKGNEISYNTVHDIGAEYLDNVGIFVGYTRESNIHHNTLYDLPYTAISMGWGWGETDMLGLSVAGGNVISHNLIHDFMKTLNDGGGIYTLGEQYGSKVYNNYLYDPNGTNYVLYRDNGSAGFLDTNNVVKSSVSGQGYYFSTNYAPMPCHVSHDDAGIGNYYSAGMISVGPGANNNIEESCIAVADEEWPDGAVSVMENAGVDGGLGEIPDLTQPNYGEYEKDDANIAIDAKATASSEYSDDYAADNIHDNKKHTRWAAKSGAVSNEWVMLDFGAEQNVDKVRVILPTGNNYEYKYKIEYSLDNSEWSLWYDQNVYTDSQDNVYELWGDPVKARYIRVTFNDTKHKGCGLIEFMAYKAARETSDKVSVLSCTGGNGVISPEGTTDIAKGKTVTYKIVPDAGYEIHNVLVDGADQGKAGSYTFADIQEPHIISATFLKKPIWEYEKLNVASARSSSQYSDDYNADKAIDGDWDNTRWAAASGKVQDEWLEVDMGSAQDVDKFRLKNNSYINSNFKFKIQYSNDEGNTKNWADAVVQDTYTESAEVSYELEESVNARFFRVYYTDTNGNGCSLYEIELSASKGEPILEEPVNTVTFVSNGGSLVQSQFIENEGIASEPEEPSKEGLLFGGWYRDDSFVTQWDFANDTVTADQILYAKWEETPERAALTAALEAAYAAKEDGTYANALPVKQLLFDIALENAEKVKKDLTATEEKMKEVTEKLLSATEGLRVYADKGNLEYYLGLAKQAQADGSVDKLVPDVKERFNTAVVEGDRLMEDKNASQEDVDAAWQELREVINMLSMEAGDKSVLQKAADAVNEMMKSVTVKDYEQDAIDKVNEALGAAQDVLDDPNALAEGIEKALNDLGDAVENLNNSQKDWRALEALVQDGSDNILPDIEAGKYVANEAIDVYKDAYEAGKAMLDAGTASQAEINEKVQALRDASVALRYKANKEVLESLLEEIGKMDMSIYTEESVAEFNVVVQNAADVMNDETLSADDQEVVETTVKELQDAKVKVLKLKDTTGTDNPGDGNTDPGKPDGDKNNNNGSAGNENGGNTAGGNHSGKGSSPKTGDESKASLPIILMCLAGAGIVGTVIIRKRKI